MMMMMMFVAVCVTLGTGNMHHVVIHRVFGSGSGGEISKR